MPAVHVREVPEDVLAALKRRARRHDRSLQGELRQILAAIAEEEPATEPLPPLELEMSPAAGKSTWRREEIYGEDGR